MTARIYQPARSAMQSGEAKDNWVLEFEPEKPREIEPLINSEQAAAILQINEKTVRRMAADGLIPGLRIGKLWRFRASALDAWVTSQLQWCGHPCPPQKGNVT